MILGSAASRFEATRQPSSGPSKAADLRPDPLTGTATCSDQWVRMLGTYDDVDQEMEEELQEELGLGSGELEARRKQKKAAEFAGAKKVMSADERAMEVVI